MAVSRVSFEVFAIIAIVYSVFFPLVHGQSMAAPAPAPANDGTTIDQGIAYILMLVALALTYLIH
ncbi:arabinogalactan peptide 22-like [Carica papaya]|uniref:arabinogalactan peptide 22-like n=1 Tax=Carica papaya TaxID=3649 RepID=UPI000B8CB929|nr:arabinogalactan peptide 22-like [Carica papaya]